MKSLHYEIGGGAYPAQKTFKPVHFYCYAPQAKTVELTGDFNFWSAVPMRQRADGWWCFQAQLAHGHHQYRFLIDGLPTLDPRAAGFGRDDANEAVSIIAVS